MNYASRYRNTALSQQSYLPFKVTSASLHLASAIWLPALYHPDLFPASVSCVADDSPDT